MSHTVLRRVAIRLLHDPAFVEALHDDPARALANVDLSSEEQRWLVRVPRAAWRADPDRPDRVLAALRDEFPATVGLAPTRAAGFLRSKEFHAAVQERGSLAVAFGTYMAGDADRRVTTIARLESAVASVRRAPNHVAPSRDGRLRLVPSARIVRVPAGAAELLAAVRAGTPEPALASNDEPVLVLRAQGSEDVTIERLSPDLATLLDLAASEVSRGELEAAIRSHGSTPAEAVEIVDGLVSEAILR
jgi:hypothetical protein